MIALATCCGDKLSVYTLPKQKPTLQICAWCWPLLSDYLRAHPEHVGREIGHTVCDAHKSKVIREALALKEARR